MSDDDEHVSDTRYDHETTKENNEVSRSTETQADSARNIHNETVDLNVVECGQALGTNNQELAFPSEPSHFEWLGESMMNMNINIVTGTNDESLNMPLLPTTLNNKFVHYYVDVEGVEKQVIDNADGALPPHDPTSEPSTTLELGRFLKLQVEIVATQVSTRIVDHLQLSKSSKLLTSDDYITLLVEAE